MREHELIRAIDRDDLARVDELLAAGADTELTNRHGVPALALAAIWGRTKILRRLLAAGADPNRTFGDGRATALMVVRNATCARALVEAGGDINARDACGVTVVAHAFHAAEASTALKRALLELGADPTVENLESHLCPLDTTIPKDRALLAEFGFDPDERPGPRLGSDVLLTAVREEADRLGWDVPDDPPWSESRHTMVFELRPEQPGGWTEEDLERRRTADPDEQERIGIEVRERRRRRAIRVDVRTGEVTSHW